MFEKLLKLFKKKDLGPIPDFSDVKVKLKPVAGIRPGMYLTAIYGFVILLVIFLVFFLPGISANGTYITFKSRPVRAGVWIDGIKAGVTPCEILVPAGSREITITRPFFEPVTMKKQVGNFVFAIPFFPRRETIESDVTIADSRKLAEYAFKEFSQWALIERFNEEYHYPPVLSETLQAIAAKPDAETYSNFRDLLDAALPFVHNPDLAKDYLAASLILETRGKVLTPGGLAGFIQRHKKLLSAPGNGIFLLYSLLPPGTADDQKIIPNPKHIPLTQKELSAVPQFQTLLNIYRKKLAAFSTSRGTASGGSVSFNSVSFRAIPSGRYIMGENEDPASMLSSEYSPEFPHPVSVASFYIASTEITNQQFKSFLVQNPQWQKKNLAQLVKDELADEYYLTGWEDNNYPTGSGSYPATYISAYAAEAYCKWLSARVELSMPGKIVRLPMEAEWEWAATAGNPESFIESGARLDAETSRTPGVAGAGGSNRFGLYDMSGNVFEWCADWYAKSLGLAANVNTVHPVNAHTDMYPFGGAKAVRGGAWITRSNEITAATRGCQPPYFCTPYLGFRPVIAEK
ncbi:MAG: SUMF1/EgtB/PvdO family nonheme iron enzyme [Spirochaetales bacterium]|nr:SUMF1/EgtB/PvdO family nonheme iron enzyme [Spirochaetales bacterium]